MRANAQGGQALVLGLALLLAGSVALALLAGAGRATATKHRLVNAADAAALSAAVWRARVLNFDAYSNRAIVANEVAVAQAATLVSWSRYFETLAENAATVSRLFPPVTAFFEALENAAELSRQAAETAAELEIGVRAASGVGYKDLLQTSQELMHLTADAFALSMLAAEVARANDRTFFAYMLPGDAFGRFTRRHASNDDRQRLRGVVEASLDPFTGGGRSANLPVAPSGCALSLDAERMFNWVRKRGATVLADDLDRWEAHDTASLHAWRNRGGVLGIGGRCSEQEMIAMGWGGAEADRTPDGTIETTAHDTARNPQARDRAESDMSAYSTYGGLARVRELALDALDDDRYPASRLAVLARTGTGVGQGGDEPGEAADTGEAVDTGGAARPSEAAGSGLAAESGGAGGREGRAAAGPGFGGRLNLREAHAGGRQWALATAEVRFRRPRSAGGPIEWASLYNPYWQARLVEPTPADRALADAHAR